LYITISTKPRLDPRLVPLVTTEQLPTSIPIIPNTRSIGETMKWHCLVKAYKFGIRNLSKINKLKLAQAVLKMESYLAGYAKPVAAPSTMYVWYNQYEKMRNCWEVSFNTKIFKSKLNTTKSLFIQKFQTKYPNLLHDLFRHATKLVGSNTHTFQIIYHMNQRCHHDYPNCPMQGNLNLNKYRFWEFFKKNKGRLNQPTSKPHLSRANKKRRIRFVRKVKRMLARRADEPFHY
jgi:hypothetical protein